MADDTDEDSGPAWPNGAETVDSMDEFIADVLAAQKHGKPLEVFHKPTSTVMPHPDFVIPARDCSSLS